VAHRFNFVSPKKVKLIETRCLEVCRDDPFILFFDLADFYSVWAAVITNNLNGTKTRAIFGSVCFWGYDWFG
jgi:(2Fe-2S) ferredoxin